MAVSGVKKLIALLTLAVLTVACAQEGEKPSEATSPAPFKPFPEATTVQLFIDEAGNSSLRNAVAAGAVATLSDAERNEFEASFTIAAPDGVGEVASCFIPHHFFRYTDADGQHLGDIAVCFSCGGNEVSPSPELPSGSWIEEDIKRIEALVSGMGHPIEIGY